MSYYDLRSYGIHRKIEIYIRIIETSFGGIFHTVNIADKFQQFNKSLIHCSLSLGLQKNAIINFDALHLILCSNNTF